MRFAGNRGHFGPAGKLLPQVISSAAGHGGYANSNFYPRSKVRNIDLTGGVLIQSGKFITGNQRAPARFPQLDVDQRFMEGNS